MLFKVEVSKGNINYRWRNYAVKKATTEDNIIQQFLTKHNLKVVYLLVTLCSCIYRKLVLNTCAKLENNSFTFVFAAGFW